MSRAIEGMAAGAQKQSDAVAKASNITTQITTAIQKVAANAQTSAREASQAEENARSGAKTVQDTIQGMQSIKAKVGLSAVKVQDMGNRSDQIGAIVETIDDIASQTNLLALNAAIEAARAGEHGKGFAVVADEVRKLAERSNLATKEIALLIKGIQQTVTEAVMAMDESAREVEQGVARASQSDGALTSILKAAGAVNHQVEEIARAAQYISVSSNELVSSMDTVSAVVVENTAATAQMSASASEVSHSVNMIASVSEETSAAVEEVGASTEEMSAQVQEVSASAQSMAEMAKALQRVVAEFKFSAS
jgi:methyl-accepting chemotaxis protein